MNEAICKEAARISKRMGSTAVLWVCEDGLVCISNLVDSRGYLFKGGRFSQLSVDHTEENSMLELQKKLGMAIIMVTHDLGVIADMCDEIIVM